jgi:hypothetical protein
MPSYYSHCLHWCVLQNWFILLTVTPTSLVSGQSLRYGLENRGILVRLPTGKYRMAKPVLVATKCRIECVPGVNRPYHEADLSAACNIEVKNEMGRTCLMAIRSFEQARNTQRLSLTSQITGIFCTSWRRAAYRLYDWCAMCLLKECVYLFMCLFGGYYCALCYDKRWIFALLQNFQVHY